MQNVYLFNSLTNKKELFKSIKEKEVSIYVCGPTVYSEPHIGNCRPAVVFDLLRRLFLYLGYKVNYVSNITDVDDKIINKALEKGISEKELTTFYTNEYFDILNQLNVLKPNYTPKVTECMDDIISYIDNLVKSNHAYYKNGNVYFRIDSIKNYGQLSNINKDELISGSRVEKNTEKENTLDFVLWKNTSVGINWNSPWGKGRPGWHTECVVMISKILGYPIDIHGGGFDLKFPHHENEIAQCEASNHLMLANYWMHNGFIDINDQKMSKSLGNVINAKEFINEKGGLFLRYTLLNCYYRSPLKLTDELFVNNLNEINKIQHCINEVNKYIQLNDINFIKTNNVNISNFINCLCDDLNISNAMMEVFNKVKQLNSLLRNKLINNNELFNIYNELLNMLDILGLKFDKIILQKEDLELIKSYNEARNNKDFELSDKLRKQLIERKLL